MPKSLEDAIGCWTVNPSYNSLPTLARMVLETTKCCRRTTQRGNPDKLKADLSDLYSQASSLRELAESAIHRLNQIIETKELEK